MKDKKCFKCGEVKSLSDFYKHAQMKDGHLNKCKTCNKKDVASNRLDNIDYYRDYDKKRGCRITNEKLKEYRKSNPKKYKAQIMVNNHLRSGNLHKLPCETCGRKDVHGHHDDYDKPLNVRWLCPVHHNLWHKQNGEGKNAH